MGSGFENLILFGLLSLMLLIGTLLRAKVKLFQDYRRTDRLCHRFHGLA